jgi:hypothetical protein
MKLNATVSKLLTNTYVLNIVFFVSVLNIIGYVVYRNYEGVMYFILIGLLVAYFSKNMTVILGVPLILVNLFSRKTFEGAENMGENIEDINSNSENNTDTDTDTSGDIAVAKQNIKNKQDGDGETETETETEGGKRGEREGEPQPKKTEQFEAGRKKGQYNIDYASTIEDAYDDLNKVIGGDGMKRLTDDTQRLMKQQQQLAETMKGMGPLVEKMAPMLQTAQSMLSNINGGGDGKKGGDPLANLSSMLSKVG